MPALRPPISILSCSRMPRSDGLRLDMSPGLPPLDVADRSLRDPVFSGNDVLGSRIGADGKDIGFGQFGRTAECETECGAVPYSVSRVLLACAPGQIRE